MTMTSLKWVAKNKILVISGALILFISIVVRLYNLTAFPIFADEAIYIRWAQVMRAVPSLRFLPLSDGKQPLFMWLVIPALKLFSDPLYAGRIVSVASGIGTLFGIFFLTNYLFKSIKVSLIAALIYTVTPFAVFFDRMALSDSLLAMFGIWTLFLAIVTSKTLRLDFAMITGFSLGGALLTKSPALFYSLLIPFTWIHSILVRDIKGKVVYLIKLMLLFFVTYTIAYSIYNILRLGPNFHMIALRNADYVYPISHLWQEPLNPFIAHSKALLEWSLSLGPWPLLILLFVGTYKGIKENKFSTILLLMWIIAPLFIQSIYAKVFTARYVLFTVPEIAIICSLVLLKNNKIFERLAFLLLGIFLLLALRQDNFLINNPEAADLPRSERSGYLEEWSSGTGIRESANILKKKYQKDPSKKIVVGTEGYFGTLPDGLQIYLNDIPEITVIGVGLGIYDVPKSLIESKQAGNKTYLLINSTRFLGNADLLGLKLVASYPKAAKPDGSHENLLFFELENIP